MELLEVPATRINQIIEDHLYGVAPCFLSIDLESLDLILLKDLDFGRYRPWFIQAEQNDRYIFENTKQIMEYMQSVN